MIYFWCWCRRRGLASTAHAFTHAYAGLGTCNSRKITSRAEKAEWSWLLGDGILFCCCNLVIYSSMSLFNITHNVCGQRWRRFGLSWNRRSLHAVLDGVETFEGREGCARAVSAHRGTVQKCLRQERQLHGHQPSTSLPSLHAKMLDGRSMVWWRT